MKKFLLGLFISLIPSILFGGTEKKIKVFVSITPQKYFAEQVGGEKVSVSTLVPSGRSPENFDPTPKQIRDLGNADIYFTIGIPFEKIFLNKIQRTEKYFVIADTSQGIKKIKIGNEKGETDDCGKNDAHIWTDPLLVKKQAETMASELIKIDPANALFYKKNLENFCRDLDKLDWEISVRLKPYEGRTFFIYHSAMTYFAARYKLKQASIEKGEREPAPAELIKIASSAKKAGINTIFIQPEFPAAGAKAVAESIKGKIVRLSVLEYDYFKNMHRISVELAKSFGSAENE